MSIDLNKVPLFRMTHIENIPYILVHGITHRNSPAANPSYVPIGDTSLISRRQYVTLNNGRNLGEYIPFYFGPRMPMLYVIQNGYNGVTITPPQNIVYCISSVQQIIQTGQEYVFTDGHAVDSLSSVFFPDRIEEIDALLDFKSIKAKYWQSGSDTDCKRKKEAEFLVLGDIPPEALNYFAVFNDIVKEQLQQYGIPEKKIITESNFYF